MDILKSWEFPQKAWIIILTQSTLILFLFSWLLIEYQNNPFMQQYLTNIAPTLVPILSLSFGAIACHDGYNPLLQIQKVEGGK